MVIQTALASYVLLVAFPGSYWLPSLSVLIFIAGMIKYGERLSMLFAASSDNFRDSMLTGPNYVRFMEEYVLKKLEGFHVGVVDEVQEIHVHDVPNEAGIHEAYDLFLTFKRLFADAFLTSQDRQSSQFYFQNLTGQQAFDVVEIELGFMFDELYTKASIVHNVRGYVRRAITFSFTLFAWIAFQFWCEKRNYTKLDLAITHLLLGVAICLEMYAVWVLIDSDWTSNRLSRGGKTTRLVRWFQQPNRKRWSKKMAQHNLLDLCVRHKSAMYTRSRKFLRSIRKLTKIDNHLEKHWFKSFVDVSPELKELLFRQLNSYREESFTVKKYSSLSLDWIEKREFDQRILLWHIATDICYSLKWDDIANSTTDCSCEEISKQISDYMLYLFIVCPFMLPIKTKKIRFHSTSADARDFLRARHMTSSKVEACKTLLELNTEVRPHVVRGDQSQSVLFDACILAKSLLQAGDHRWKILCEVWVQMLAHAAAHCSASHHARQLRKGGELLTHVWLLMEHLGITEQVQISQGHTRAKLIVK